MHRYRNISLISINITVCCIFFQLQSGEIYIAMYLPNKIEDAAHRNMKLKKNSYTFIRTYINVSMIFILIFINIWNFL